MIALQNLVRTLRSLGGGGEAGHGPIGLEIANEKLHMVQFSAGEPPPVILAAVSLAYAGGREALLADPKKLKALIDRARSTRPFRGNHVVSSMPAGDVRTISLTCQKAADQSEAEALVTALRERMPQELDESVVDYIPIRNQDGETSEKSAVVAIARRERVIGYLEALQGAGMQVDALDIGPAALTRLVASMGDNVRYANALLINFGRERSFLSLIWGRRLMLDRDVAFGENQLVARLAKALDMAPALALDMLYRQGFEASGSRAGAQDAEIARTVTEVLRPEFAGLAGEVGRTLIYAASKTRGQSVERIYLMGSIARYPGIAGLVEALVSMPVEVLNPFSVFTARSGGAVLAELDPIAGIGMAAGLALRGMQKNG